MPQGTQSGTKKVLKANYTDVFTLGRYETVWYLLKYVYF